MVDSITSSLHSEIQLLWCCTGSGPVARERVRELAGRVNAWDWLTVAAYEHGIAPVVYEYLREDCTECVPPEVLIRLRETVQAIAAQNLRLTAVMFHLLDSFRRAGISVIPFKGPALAALGYGNLALRQFVDLDFLLSQHDVAVAEGVMSGQGFRPAFSQFAAGKRRVPGQYLFTRDAGKTTVELHTPQTLRYYPSPLPLEELRVRLQTIDLAGREVATFSAEDLLPLLCVHGSKHLWEQLSWIRDIAALANLPRGLDWSKSLRFAARLGAGRMTRLGLALAGDLPGVELPSRVTEEVRRDRAAQRLGRKLRERFFRRPLVAPGVAERFWFRVRVREGFWPSIKYGLRLATSPTEDDWTTVNLPQVLSPLYALLRPLRLFRKYGLGWGSLPATDLARYVPTPHWVVERMLELAEVTPKDVVYDLGCGDGRIVICAAERFGARGVGIDVDPRRIAEAKSLARRHGVLDRVRLLEGDAKSVDLSEATVVALGLRLEGNLKLRHRLRTQLRPGARVVARDLPVPGWPPDHCESIEAPNELGATLFLWKVAATESQRGEKVSAPRDPASG